MSRICDVTRAADHVVRFIRPFRSDTASDQKLELAGKDVGT